MLVLEDTEKRNNSKRKIFLCECDCGKKVEVDIAGLRTGDTQSCGCLRLEKMTKHASSRTKLYKNGLISFNAVIIRIQQTISTTENVG